MSVILVAGAAAGDGASTVAAGLAHRLTHAGHSVRLERLTGDDGAAADAATFGLVEVAESSGEPVEASALLSGDGGDGVTVVEAPPGADASALAGQLGAKLMLVGGSGTDGAGSGGATVIENHALSAGPLRLPEDRVLAAPTVGRLIEASRAIVLARSIEGDAAICEHLVVGAIAHDDDESYFARFPRKAVVTRAEKVDIALAALRTDTTCLILSGGADPSPYLLDRIASSRETTLLLAPEGTVETVRDIEGTFGSSPFSGAVKLERAGELMRTVIDDETLAALLA